ncbi:MAG TPA: hypothetical protein VNU01_02405 [Egibacteraceae bacterium]|nr:hypothetical protein [Egibacteraceae bacterium]
MRRLMAVCLLLGSLLAPGAARANHEIPDESHLPNAEPYARAALSLAQNIRPIPWGTTLHIDQSEETWRIDCTDGQGNTWPGECPFVLEGALDLDPHYGPLDDPGCSIPRGHSGEGWFDPEWTLGLPEVGLTSEPYAGATIDDARFARTPYVDQARAGALLIEGRWSDEHGRSDRFLAEFKMTFPAWPPGSTCSSSVRHYFIDGHVMLLGVLR